MKNETTRTRFSIRFNLDNPEHALAWEKLQEISSGKRSEYCIECILEKENVHPLVKTIRNATEKSLIEIKDAVQLALSHIQANPVPINRTNKITEIELSDKAEISDDVLNFMNNL